MSPEARAQLAVDARVLFDQARAANEAAIEKAHAAGAPSSPYENKSVRLAQIRMRVAEGNVRICGVDPYYEAPATDSRTVQAPAKRDETIDNLAVNGWVRVYQAEARVQKAQAAHEAAKRDKSKAADVYDLSLEVHLAQKSLQSAKISASLGCEGMSNQQRQQICEEALARFRSGAS